MVTWEYLEGQSWVSMGQLSHRVESAFRGSGDSVRYSVGQSDYTATFGAMVQRNDKTGYERPIRRSVRPAAAPAAPVAWECETDTGWVAYGASHSDLLSTALAAGRSATVLYREQPPGHSGRKWWRYVVDLTTSTQTNPVTNVRRAIRPPGLAASERYPRRPDLAACGVDTTSVEFAPAFDKAYVHHNHPQANASRWQTAWAGELHNSPRYYCPVGWRRFSLKIDLDATGCDWSDSRIMYHGTSPRAISKILRTGFKPAECQHGHTAVYLSPSIIYSSHPRYSRVVRHGGLFFQFILEVRVKSSLADEFKGETMRVGTKYRIDPNFGADNNELEFLFKSTKDYVNNEDGLALTGIMVRVLPSDPADLDSSDWWACYMDAEKMRRNYYFQAQAVDAGRPAAGR